MKSRFTATLTALALAGVSVQSTALAGDREWAVAGKVLTGIAAAHVLARTFDSGPRVVYHAAPAPVVYAPAPVVYQTVAPAPVVIQCAPVAPRAPVCAPAPTVCQTAPTTAVVYQSAPQVVYAPGPAPVYIHRPPVVIHPYGHHFRPRRCFARW